MIETVTATEKHVAYLRDGFFIHDRPAPPELIRRAVEGMSVIPRERQRLRDPESLSQRQKSAKG